MRGPKKTSTHGTRVKAAPYTVSTYQERKAEKSRWGTYDPSQQTGCLWIAQIREQLPGYQRENAPEQITAYVSSVSSKSTKKRHMHRKPYSRIAQLWQNWNTGDRCPPDS